MCPSAWCGVFHAWRGISFSSVGTGISEPCICVIWRATFSAILTFCPVSLSCQATFYKFCFHAFALCGFAVYILHGINPNEGRPHVMSSVQHGHGYMSFISLYISPHFGMHFIPFIPDFKYGAGLLLTAGSAASMPPMGTPSSLLFYMERGNE